MLLAARPWSFSMTAISVTLAAVASLGVMPFCWGSYLVVLGGMILVHAATNLLNDFFDVRHGVDRPDSPTARYRTHPLLAGIYRPKQLLAVAVGCYGLAAVGGAFLALRHGAFVAAFAAVGTLASVFYTAGPVKYKHLALGEAAVFLMWGPLMMLATSRIIAGGWDRALPMGLLSIPQGGWVALVIFANNMKDSSYDGRTGVRTLANLLGRRRSQQVFIAALACLYALTAVLIGLRIIPLWGLAAFASLPAVVKLAAVLVRSREVPPDADPRTARAGMIYGLLLIAAFLAARLV
jgi:1,4-dihydroxy-2-naphthoate octaprenyltransferase